MTDTNVVLATPDMAGVWDAYAVGNGTFFHRYGWGQVVRATYNHEPVYLCAVRNREICGVLPLIDRRSALFGRSLISVGFTVGGGILADDDAAREALIIAATDQAHARGADYIELRSHNDQIDGWAEKHGIYDNFSCQIDPDPEARLKAIPRKKRADIRKAIKAAEAGNIKAEVTEDATRFWRHYARAQRNHGTPVFPKNWLLSQQAAFGSAMDITLIEADGEPMAGVVSYFEQDRVLLYNAFISDDARRHHAGDYLYWWKMGHAAERGVREFDLGRSKRGTGSHSYKTFWGFEPEPMVYLYKMMRGQDLPNVNPQNPKFAMMTRAWRHLPMPVANRLGPILAGHLA